MMMMLDDYIEHVLGYACLPCAPHPDLRIPVQYSEPKERAKGEKRGQGLHDQYSFDLFSFFSPISTNGLAAVLGGGIR